MIRATNKLQDMSGIKKNHNFKSKVSVTFYQYSTFVNTFDGHFKDPQVVQYSLSPSNNIKGMFKAGEGAGRSGSFFFCSHDNKFIIKTMTKDELFLFLKLLPNFAKHYKDNPSSLIARIFGVFTVKMESTGEVHFMLMENTLRLENPNNIQYIFDLVIASGDPANAPSTILCVSQQWLHYSCTFYQFRERRHAAATAAIIDLFTRSRVPYVMGPCIRLWISVRLVTHNWNSRRALLL